MATAAISYGTEVWLGELLQAGWILTVSERRTPGRSVRLVDSDEFEPMTLIHPETRVGVLASALADGREGSRVFVPCSSTDEAWRLLQRVEAEVAGVL